MKTHKNTTKFLFVVVLVLVALTNEQVLCFLLNYSSFPLSVSGDFIPSGDAYTVDDAFQVTQDTRGENVTHMDGRILYKKKFKLWNKKKNASFNCTFVLRITPESGSGEGLGFILTKDIKVPNNSDGPWLGIVNASTNGSKNNNIVAIEFDTKKSFPHDIDGNHVGLDINSVYSHKQVSLNSSNITIASGMDLTAMILYDGQTKRMNVSVFKGNYTTPSKSVPVMSVPVDLRQHLPSKVYIGLSASTGSGYELNCVRSWYFTGTDIDSEKPLWVWVVISVVITVMFVMCFCGGYLYWRATTKIRYDLDDDPTIQGLGTSLGPKKIKLKELKAATGNFSAKNELGKGGFSIVYKGTWRDNIVAIKRIINTPLGKQNLIAEVTTIGSLHHKNIVKLIGWCYEGNELLLVYEYMPNGSLDMFIYGTEERKLGKGPRAMLLSWERRHNIICGVAQALDYLHHECAERVLHRDIKASNIMLDSEFNARLGDFGLARMFKLSEKTHHTTREIAGTPGYMAPEIFLTGRITAETDVFAFGVLTLVVACGKKPEDHTEEKEYRDSIIDWVWELYNQDVTTEAMDPRLKGNFDSGQAECMLMLGLACCHPNPYMRPTMRNALQVLMGEALPPSVPFEKPVFMWPATNPEITREETPMTPFSSVSAR